MRRSIKLLSAAWIMALLAACAGPGGPGSVSRDQRTVSTRAPVPVSAAQQSDFNKALAMMKKQNYADAIPLLEAVLAENDRLPGTHINLAIAYMKMPEDDEAAERMQKAEQSLLRAVELSPREAVGHFQLAYLYRKTGRFPQARQSYEQALRLDANYALAHYNLGVLCDIYLQQAECAIKHFEVYSQLVPDEAEKIGRWLTDIRRRAGIAEPATAANSGAEK